MSKKIDSALTALIKALITHGDIVGSHHGSVKHTARAAFKVRIAAVAYANAVEKRTGQSGLFEHLDRFADHESAAAADSENAAGHGTDESSAATPAARASAITPDSLG